jgi:quaternary ammonium compound-resistance protein SugE
MAWWFLVLAGLLEVVWAFAMKLSDGFTNVRATITMVSAMLGSFTLLALAMKTLPLGTAYAVWTGIGAVGAFVAGAVFLQDSVTPTRLLAVVLVLAGLVLLKLSS